jgi:NADPH:quinone reductase
VAEIAANKIFGDTEHHIAFQAFVVIDEDLSDQSLVAWLEAEKMKMCRAVTVALLGTQHFPRRPVCRHGVAGRLDGAKPEPSVFISIKPPPQIHVGLPGILVLVKTGRGSLPDIDLRPLDRLTIGICDAEVGEELRTGRGRAHNAAAVWRRRGVVAPERAEQRSGGFSWAFPAVVHEDHKGGEPDGVGEKNALVVDVGGGFADAVEEIDRKIVLVLSKLHLPRKSMQVAHESGHYLPQAGVRSTSHGPENDVSDVVRIFDDAVGRNRPGWRWFIWFHRITSDVSLRAPQNKWFIHSQPHRQQLDSLDNINMRALKFFQTGSLDNLQVEEVATPKPAAGEVLVQVKAAAVNPSDVKNVQGKMHETTVPRIPGRDFAGIVVEGPDALVGQSVFGSGGNLGSGRDGSHAEFLVVPVSGVLPLPKNLSFAEAGGIGVAYMTAWAAIVDTARIQSGETALILGTTGAVGSAAARIAQKFGARVIGTSRKGSDIPASNTLPVDHWINLEADDLATETKRLTDGRGADVVLDVVGGPLFEKCLAALTWRGRQVSISSGSQPRVNFNLVDFYHNESRLLGVDSFKLGFEETAEILRQLTPGIESGIFPAPRAETFSLEEGPRVYRDIDESKIKGKPILVP